MLLIVMFQKNGSVIHNPLLFPNQYWGLMDNAKEKNPI